MPFLSRLHFKSAHFSLCSSLRSPLPAQSQTARTATATHHEKVYFYNGVNCLQSTASLLPNRIFHQHKVAFPIHTSAEQQPLTEGNMS